MCRSRVESGDGQFLGGHRSDHVAQPQVVIGGVSAETLERVLHVEVGTFGDHALRLLDDDAGVERD